MDLKLPFTVSRETMDKLDIYFQTLKIWNRTHNLVSDTHELWDRHVRDSAQLIPYLQPNTIFDLGSGGGFPGIIVAILCPYPVYLFEQRYKKIVFLEHICHTLGLSAKVVAGDMQTTLSPTLLPPGPITITARALGSLSYILSLLQNVSRETQMTCLLHKSQQQLEEELPLAMTCWDFHWESYPSLTDETGRILCIRGIQKRGHGTNHCLSKSKRGSWENDDND